MSGEADAEPWRCPGCRGGLHRVVAHEGTFSGCPDCGGMWLDNLAATSVMHGQLTPPARDFIARVTASVRAPRVEAAATRPSSQYREAAVDSTRACPVCGATLEARRLPDPAIVLDLCAAHGTYFDHRELAAVVARVDEHLWAAYQAAHQHAARAAWQAEVATGDTGVDELVRGFGDVLRSL